MIAFLQVKNNEIEFLLFIVLVAILQVDVEEVMYVAKELWHGRSAREQLVKDVGRGMWRSVNELMLVRYGVAFVSIVV